VIYCTVGTMFLDFERLLKKMDEIAAKSGEKVICQTGLSKVHLVHCEHFDFKSREEIWAIHQRARVIVCHGGIGSALDALRFKKPIIVVPRRECYGEHLTDHQLDIAEAIERRGWGRMILDMADLDEACANPPAAVTDYEPDKAQLIATLRGIVNDVAEKKARRRGRIS